MTDLPPLEEPPYDPEYDDAPPDTGGPGGGSNREETGGAGRRASGGREPAGSDRRSETRTSETRTSGTRTSETRTSVTSPPATPIETVVREDVESSDELRSEAETALRALVGRDDAVLREDQWRAISALVADRARALVVQRTGWGKSAVYFVATSLLRARGAGPTVIVSPLLALMRDQVAAASRAGIRAVTINSANVTEWDGIHADIAAGEVDVLLCSPERLNNPAFRAEVLPRLAATAGLVVVDEAHCVSDWGHDFRPDYRRIRTLLETLPPGTPVLATTATANERVSTDVAEQLGAGLASTTTGGAAVGTSGGAAGAGEVLVLRGSLARDSLRLAVLPRADAAVRVAWLMEYLRGVEGSGIVYCLTVAMAEEVATQLRGAGLDVAAYTGRTEPSEREQLEADLLSNRVKALVATSALGMGFDKPDLGFVVHLGAPSSPIAYYQQIGRAGRGVASADVVLAPGPEDRAIWDYFGSLAFPPAETVHQVLEALAGSPDRIASTARLETAVDLRRSRLEMMLSVLDVDGAVSKVRGGWQLTGQEWVYDAERYARVEQARLAEQASMIAYEKLDGTDACRVAYLRRQLDDPELPADWRCGRCDLCDGPWAPTLPGADAAEDVRVSLARAGVEIVPRRQWPTGMPGIGIDLAGRIAVDDRSEPGTALARMDGIGLASSVRDAVGPSATDGQVGPELRAATRAVLERWITGGGIRVDGVVSVSSATRPQLVDHLTRGAAAVLGVPVVGRFVARGGMPPGRHDLNSAQRLAVVDRRLELELSDGARAGLANRTLLLVDDYTDSGWTLTLAARLLRRAGAVAVHPFTLGVR
ncbi:RecQ family ATP-dependent DNA helicase [Serinibacter arcticus]|nr:DEAD/DEAH box helicase [Serinibacter arcticus]